MNKNIKIEDMKIEDMNEDNMKGKRVEVLNEAGNVVDDGICIGMDGDEVHIFDRGEGFSCDKSKCRVVEL